MTSTYEYPSTSDPDFLSKIYQKREFYFHKIAPRFKPLTQEEINDYRNNVCGGDFKMQSQQSFLANFINPQTPYKGVIIFHGTGSGKTCAAIAIAEQFKEQVEKYNTKIYVLLPGPILKEQFKNELVTICTNYFYIHNKEEFKFLSPEEKNKAKKDAIYSSMKYYNIISYKNFHRRVLGEKLKETITTEDQKRKTKFKTNDEGEIERERSLNKLDNLDNTLIIIDEAHNFTDNEYGDSLIAIIKNSKNLKIVLLTATPMKNLGDDIIPLLNFIRPLDDPIIRSKVFEGHDYQMKFQEGGREYLQKMATGYISYFRGGNPFTFAEKVEIGEIPKELMFTPLIRCIMEPFHLDVYKNTIDSTKDSLDKISEAVSNFVFPAIDIKTKEIIGLFGEKGREKLEILLHENKFLEKINEKFFHNEVESSEIMIAKKGRISGKIFEMKYLRQFSPKFHECLKNLRNVNGTAFIYSNLVQVGVKLFEEVLLANGYIEYLENSNYIFNKETLHYKYNITYEKFQEKYKNEEFIPATFITVTGGIEDGMDIPTEKLNTIRNVFNDTENQNGRFIKFLVGSKVVNEGVTLENLQEIHILDSHYHLGRVDQVIGRGIRHCKHFKSITKDNINPKVSIYKYVVSIPGFKELSKEEELYRKAEQKYLTIKKVERSLIEISVDCPINFAANQLIEDVIKYKDCTPISEFENDKNKKNMLCPSRCEFEKCQYKCGQNTLNLEFYDQSRNIYKNLNRSHLDYSTFSKTLAKTEIEFAKNIIKDLYRLDDFYKIQKIIHIVQNKYPEDKRELFDEFFVYQALDQLLPISEEDLMSFNDFIYNKYNVLGYLTYKNSYYLFQPLSEKTDISLEYRTSFHESLVHELSLGEFVHGVYKDIPKAQETKELLSYDFELNQGYYDSREENDYVGIIDKPPNIKRLVKTNSAIFDVFKLREKRKKQNEKKREIGLPSIKGATCQTAKSKLELLKIAKAIGITLDKKDKNSRNNLCDIIKERLLYLEKYAGKDSGIPKKTYIILPYDHPMYLFPYNIEDRIDYIEKLMNVKIKVKRKDLIYNLEILNTKTLDSNILKKYKFTLEKDVWTVQY